MNNRSHLVRVVRLFPCPKNRPMREPGVFTFQFLNVKIDHNTKFAKLTIVKWLLWYNCNVYHWKIEKQTLSTGKSLSEANPPTIRRQIVHWITSSIHENSKLKPGENMLCIEIVSDIQNNFCTQCSAKRRASDKDLPVLRESDGRSFWMFLIIWSSFKIWISDWVSLTKIHFNFFCNLLLTFLNFCLSPYYFACYGAHHTLHCVGGRGGAIRGQFDLLFLLPLIFGKLSSWLYGSNMFKLIFLNSW